jgi:hypothetical protein
LLLPLTTYDLRLTWISLPSLRKLLSYICNWHYIASAPTTEKTVFQQLERNVNSSIAWQCCQEVFTATLCSNQCGVVCLGSARLSTVKTPLSLLLALHVFGREVFNGQLPRNAVTIHVTLSICCNQSAW